jgi:arginase family enzyme
LSKKVKIFGAALDCLDDPERLGLKLSYLQALRDGHVDASLPKDPYDIIAPAVSEIYGDLVSLRGKVEMPGWVKPRPSLEDIYQVSQENYREFMDSGGPAEVADRCQKLAGEILPDVPLMIAVDHSLSAGPIRAVSGQCGPESLAVVVLDSHFDAVTAEARAGRDLSWKSDDLCGAFLAGLLNDGFVLPPNLFVIGVSDYPSEALLDTPYGREYSLWLEKGVKVYPKDKVRQKGFFRELEKELSNLGANVLYVSLDADVGACSAMPAVRFMDAKGLDENEVREVATALGRLIDKGRFSLGGMDVAEIDVHFLDLDKEEGNKDRTIEICAEFVMTLSGRR